MNKLIKYLYDKSSDDPVSFHAYMAIERGANPEEVILGVINYLENENKKLKDIHLTHMSYCTTTMFPTNK